MERREDHKPQAALLLLFGFQQGELWQGAKKAVLQHPQSEMQKPQMLNELLKPEKKPLQREELGLVKPPPGRPPGGQVVVRGRGS